MKPYSLLFFTALLVQAVAVSLKAGPALSLLPIPDPSVHEPTDKPPYRFWNSIASGGSGTFRYSMQDGGILARMESSGIARMQLGTAAMETLVPAYGKMVRASVEVKGKITRLAGDGLGPVLVLEISGGGQSAGVQIGPKMTHSPDPKRAAKVEKFEGELEWTPLEAVFRLPPNTERINFLMYLMNAEGQLEWRRPIFEIIADDAVATVPMRESFPTAAEAQAQARERFRMRYEKNMAAIRERMGLPEPADLYEVRKDTAGKRPRLFYEGLSPSQLKARAADPAFADVVEQIRLQARRWANTPPPASVSLTAEDPARMYAEVFPWLALAVLMESNEAEKKFYRDGLLTWFDAHEKWGISRKNLPLAQSILTLCCVYDWMQDELDPKDLARIRLRIIRSVREQLDESNGELMMWRAGEWLANHNWFQHAARGTAALTLWGDESDPLQPGELKSWLDDAMTNFWVVGKTHPKDGAAVEGYLYQDYGLRPYFDFAAAAEDLTTLKSPLLKDDAIRNLKTRLHALLPDLVGFMVYNDSRAHTWDGAMYFRWIARQWKDREAQLLAELMERKRRPLSPVPPESAEGGSLKAYIPPVGKAAESAAPLLVLGKGFELPPEAFLQKRPGSVEEAVIGFNKPGAKIRATFEVREPGHYQLLLSYALQESVAIRLRVNDQVPFREADYWLLDSTGGWSRDTNQFLPVWAGSVTEDEDTPWVLNLPAGKTTVTLEALRNNGPNVNYLALVPAGRSLDAALVSVGDEAGRLSAIRPNERINWRNLFWKDPAVPPAVLAEQPTHYDADDFGLFTARTDWKDPRALFFGLRCGPAAGRSVRERYQEEIWSGHMYPEQGSFSFYKGHDALFPGVDYARTKLTTNHNLVVFEGRAQDRGKMVGQLGEGGPWFGLGYRNIERSAQVIEVRHEPGLHHYLCDLGGLYGLKDERVPSKTVFPEYHRGLTFFTEGALVVVDRIRTPVPRAPRLRLLTGGKTIAEKDGIFSFVVGKTSAQIRNVSPTSVKLSTALETLPTWGNGNRAVAILEAPEAEEMVFAVVISLEGVGRRISVRQDPGGYTIQDGPSGKPVRVDWPKAK